MSSTIEQDLSEDLILEILSRLPPIILLRFKSVSKTWYSLISNPDFRRRHTAQLYQFHILEEEDPSPPPPPGILLLRKLHARESESNNVVFHPHPGGVLDHHQQKKLALLLENLNYYRPAMAPLNESSTTAPAKKDENFMLLADSCNGLLLYVHKYIGCKTLYVCNPITKDCTKLPIIDDIVDDKDYEIKVAQIVFSPSFSLTYKVFTWVQCLKQTRLSSGLYDGFFEINGRLYVYSSETKSWRLSVPELPQLFSPNHLKAVLWNGVLHWITFINVHTSESVCLCYDIEKETVWTMKWPKVAMAYTPPIVSYFGLCGERLLLILKTCNSVPREDLFPASIDVMELKQHNRDGDGEGEDIWSVRYHVNFNEGDYDYYLNRPNDHTTYSFTRSYVSILDIYRTMRRNNKEEEEEMLLKIGYNMTSFSLTNNTFGIEELSNIEIDYLIDYFSDFQNILGYTITLCPP